MCADPRGFSQLIASFVASESLGIPHTPLSSLSPDLLYCSPRPAKGGAGAPCGAPIVPCTVLLCFFFSVRKGLDPVRTLSQYVNELFVPAKAGIPSGKHR